MGRKPAGYSPASSPRQKAERRTYYAARITLMKRHHEIMLYRMRAKENGAAVCDENVLP